MDLPVGSLENCGGIIAEDAVYRGAQKPGA